MYSEYASSRTISALPHPTTASPGPPEVHSKYERIWHATGRRKRRRGPVSSISELSVSFRAKQQKTISIRRSQHYCAQPASSAISLSTFIDPSMDVSRPICQSSSVFSIR
jgi:hypothetical protein